MVHDTSRADAGFMGDLQDSGVISLQFKKNVVNTLIFDVDGARAACLIGTKLVQKYLPFWKIDTQTLHVFLFLDVFLISPKKHLVRLRIEGERGVRRDK